MNSALHIQQPEQKIIQAQQNMELPQTLIYRYNSSNRAYGFEQTLGRNMEHRPTLGGGMHSEGEFPYKFTVAGNYKGEGEQQ